MKNNEVVRIAIAETSVIIRGGLTAALKRLSNVKVQPIELLSVEALHDCVRTQCPEMLIVNPLSKKIAGLLNVVSEEEEMDNQDTLSQREKEIVICVVKGMTNKEIAEKLFLSIHTVITHRRNISKKLQIHSAAGLTIYAIVNKLVALSDVKDL